jgi:hypothetical protein
MYVMMSKRGVEAVAGWLIGVAELYEWVTTGNEAGLRGVQW